jgi:hypothetical protein
MKTDYINYMRMKFCTVLLLFFVSSCNKSTTIPECNPEEGRFINGKHYISGNMLKEGNTWDLITFHLYYYRKGKLYPDSNCIPVTQPPSFEETIFKILEDIDLQGRGAE